jgi:hypothetical protein
VSALPPPLPGRTRRSMVLFAPVELEPDGRRGRSGASLGLASALLLAAAFQWAHHWGPLADTIVGAWVLTTIGALVASAWALSCRGGARRLAKLGLWLGLLSVVVVAGAGVAAAAGVDPASACGGG